MNLFDFLLVTLSNIISLNVRDGKIKLCFTDIGAEDLSLESLLEEVDEALEGQDLFGWLLLLILSWFGVLLTFIFKNALNLKNLVSCLFSDFLRILTATFK